MRDVTPPWAKLAADPDRPSAHFGVQKAQDQQTRERGHHPVSPISLRRIIANSGKGLEHALPRYVDLYNNHLPQANLNCRTPCQVMFEWHEKALNPLINKFTILRKATSSR